MAEFTAKYGTIFEVDDETGTLVAITYQGDSITVPTSDIIEAVRDKIARPNILLWIESMIPPAGPPAGL